jgi:membrane associated rhomboid family serine protease
MFMHGSWMHIIGNMVYLLIFGDQIEDEFGHFKFLFFYLAAGVGATVAQVMASPESVIPCVGASGAIAGTLGAYLVLHPNNRVRVLVIRSIVMLPASLVLGMWIVMQLFGQVESAAGKASGVAYMAHIGGFVVGVVASFIAKISVGTKAQRR